MNDDQVYDFGMRLRQLRKDRGMSRVSLAKKLGVSKETVYRYENNIQNPSLDRTRQLAIILQTSVDYLVGLDNEYTVKFPTMTKEQHRALSLFLQAFINK